MSDAAGTPSSVRRRDGHRGARNDVEAPGRQRCRTAGPWTGYGPARPDSATVESPHGRLGEPVRIFDGRAGRWRVWAWVVPLVVVSLALVPVAVVQLRDGGLLAGIPALALSMGAAASAGWIAGRVGPSVRDRVVRLYTGGIAVTGPRGDTEYVWDDLVSVTVSGVRARPDGPTRWRFTVETEGGDILRFTDDLPDVQVLAETVAREVASRIVPRRLVEVKAGKPVTMGPFTIDREGVEKDGERLPWRAVDDVVIDNGLVTVRARESRTDLTTVAAQMPDAAAFAALCRQVADLSESS